MQPQISEKPDFELVTMIVSDAGGRIVGRTKLQKIAYLLEATGLGAGFSFKYRHYGPYSEDLASAAQIAQLLGGLTEEEHPTTWGGLYSIYTTSRESDGGSARNQLAKRAVDADSIELELAATAVFLAMEGSKDPWDETSTLKPEKATPTRLGGAKRLYKDLRQITTPKPLPAIV